MKRSISGFVLLVGAVLLFAGNVYGQATAGTNSLSSVKSTAEVRKLLPVGMTTNEVIATIGPPPSELALKQPDELLWTYILLRPFPADDSMRGTYVTSLSVWIANSRVTRVSFGYQKGPSTVRREEIPGQATTNGSVTVGLFVVSTNAYPRARFIDTEYLPKLGYIATQPDLTIRRLEEVVLEEEVTTDSEGHKSTNWVFIVELTREDGRRFADLTSTNSGRKVLIMVGKEPIAAPMVMEPIEGGRLRIVGDLKRDYIRTNLAKLRR